MSNQLGPVFFKGISNVTAVPDVELGVERVESGEVYRYVYNCGGSSISTGKGVSRPVSAAAGLYSVSVSGALGDVCLGFVKHVAIPAGEYGWVLKRGLVTVAVASSASDQSAGPKAMGAAGIVSTFAAGLTCIGELTTLIVSGNSGALFVNVP